MVRVHKQGGVCPIQAHPSRSKQATACVWKKPDEAWWSLMKPDDDTHLIGSREQPALSRALVKYARKRGH